LSSGSSDFGAENLLRELAPQVLGAVVRRFGHFAAAEDAVQEALLAAALQWPREGVPDKSARLADRTIVWPSSARRRSQASSGVGRRPRGRDHTLPGCGGPNDERSGTALPHHTGRPTRRGAQATRHRRTRPELIDGYWVARNGQARPSDGKARCSSTHAYRNARAMSRQCAEAAHQAGGCLSRPSLEIERLGAVAVTYNNQNVDEDPHHDR